jgi:hypothetical protein
MKMIVMAMKVMHAMNCHVVKQYSAHVSVSKQVLHQKLGHVTIIGSIVDRHVPHLAVLPKRPNIYIAPVTVSTVGRHVGTVMKANVTDLYRQERQVCDLLPAEF